ncbi:hypothetical protein TNCV_390371 [Trichonephila clavipes]|nr:hypothetical protein TNCV_390371 [Trichonephila clavipes]
MKIGRGMPSSPKDQEKGALGIVLVCLRRRHIILSGWMEVQIFKSDSLTIEFYCKKVIFPQCICFEMLVIQTLFLWKTTSSSSSFIFSGLLESDDIRRMIWLAYSPDLKFIENVKGALGRRFVA